MADLFCGRAVKTSPLLLDRTSCDPVAHDRWGKESISFRESCSCDCAMPRCVYVLVCARRPERETRRKIGKRSECQGSAFVDVSRPGPVTGAFCCTGLAVSDAASGIASALPRWASLRHSREQYFWLFAEG
jgi:hypothetical protein